MWVKACYRLVVDRIEVGMNMWVKACYRLVVDRIVVAWTCG